MNKLTLLLVLLINLAACKKEESKMWTEVHVTATNYNTEEPLDDIFISIVETKDGLFTTKGDAIYESFTDENGTFYYGWKAKRSSNVSYEYVVQANPEKYHQVEFQQIDYLQKGESHYYDVKLVESGALNMNFQNVNCFNENDELRFRYYFKKNPSATTYIYIYSFYWDGELTLDGCVDLTGNGGYQVLPAGNYTIEWNVTRDNGYTEGSDTFFVGDGDSLTYLLQY
ncbi:MAG: hypothetical protein HUJ25_03490 [Crocinitomicaceae bacterium]|nr:hypothetical protein [Crocinitomicaceae bacterium]